MINTLAQQDLEWTWITPVETWSRPLIFKFREWSFTEIKMIVMCMNEKNTLEAYIYHRDQTNGVY